MAGSWRDTIKSDGDQAQQPASGWRSTITSDVSDTESAIRGLAQGASLGFSDEITGALEALVTQKNYEQARDEARKNNELAEQANPVAYGQGQLGGSVATAFVPGLNVAKGASLASRAGIAALGGGLSGLGLSTEKDVGGMAQDAAIGAALGGALQYGGEKYVAPAIKKVGGYVADKFDDGLGKLGKVAANVDEDVTKRYLNRAAQMNEAPALDDIGSYLKDDALDQFRTQLSALDSEAWKALKVEPQINTLDILEITDDFMQGLLGGKKGDLTRKAAIGADGEKMSALRRVFDEIKSAYGDQLSEADLKSIVSTLQKQAYSFEGSPKTSSQGEAIRQLSGVYNDFLKTINPQYKKLMEPVAEATNTLAKLERSFINRQAPDSVEKFMQVAKRLPKKVESSEAVSGLRGLDKSTGAGVEDMIKDRLALDAFSKSDTNGSRKTLFGAIAGQAIAPGLGALGGYAVGDEGGALGGAAIGFGADRFAGQAFKQLLNARLAAPQLVAKINQLAPSLGKYASVLKEAASRGNSALAATHFLLSQRDPEYAKKVGGQQ